MNICYKKRYFYYFFIINIFIFVSFYLTASESTRETMAGFYLLWEKYSPKPDTVVMYAFREDS